MLTTYVTNKDSDYDLYLELCNNNITLINNICSFSINDTIISSRKYYKLIIKLPEIKLSNNKQISKLQTVVLVDPEDIISIDKLKYVNIELVKIKGENIIIMNVDLFDEFDKSIIKKLTDLPLSIDNKDNSININGKIMKLDIQ